MALHKDAEMVDIHAPISFEYANATARNGATGLTADDVRKFARQLDDNSIWMLTDEDPVTWVEVGSGAAQTFGSEFQKGESLTLSTTTAEEWQEKLSLETPSLPAGTYRIEVSFWWYLTGTTSRAEFQVERDDTEQIIHRHAKASWGVSDAREFGYALAYATLSAGVHTFDLDFKRDGGSATLGIGGAVMEIWRVQ